MWMLIIKTPRLAGDLFVLNKNKKSAPERGEFYDYYKVLS